MPYYSAIDFAHLVTGGRPKASKNKAELVKIEVEE